MVDRDRPTLEEEVQPEDVGQRAVSARVAWRQRNALTEQFQRLLVIEVVCERLGAGHERVGRVLQGSRRRETERKDDQQRGNRRTRRARDHVT